MAFTVNETKTPYTVSVIFPPTPAYDAFCMVRDWMNDEKTLMSALKIPGGKVVGNEKLGEAGKTEVVEETGRRIENPTEIILVVHKQSTTESVKYHHHYFFKGGPPLEPNALQPQKSEIAWVGWMSEAEIKNAIWPTSGRSEFLAAHALALRWYFIRDKYFRKREEWVIHRYVLHGIFYKSWGIDEESGTMIVCQDERCAEKICQEGRIFKPRGAFDEERPTQRERAYDEKEEDDRVFDRMLDQNEDEVAGKIQEAIVAGKTTAAYEPELRSKKVKFVLFYSTQFEDYVLLREDGRPDKFRLFTDNNLKSRAAVEERLKMFANGAAADFIIRAVYEEDVVVANLDKIPAGFRSLSLQSPPPYHSIGPDDLYAIQDGLKAWTAKKNKGSFLSWVDHHWKGERSNWITVAIPENPDKGDRNRESFPWLRKEKLTKKRAR